MNRKLVDTEEGFGMWYITSVLEKFVKIFLTQDCVSNFKLFLFENLEKSIHTLHLDQTKILNIWHAQSTPAA